VLDKMFETKKGRLSIHKQREVIDKVFGVRRLEDVLHGLDMEALAWSAGEENQILRWLHLPTIPPYLSAFGCSLAGGLSPRWRLIYYDSLPGMPGCG
jgi:hypothetical protein